MRTFLTALAIVALAACDQAKDKLPNVPGGVPVIVQFAITPATAKAPALVEFAIKTDNATRCEILGIGDVTCNGIKSWSIATAGSMTFSLLAYGTSGQIARQSAIVTVTP
jgi:hypothetical protein